MYCKICGATEEPELSKEEESMADYMRDFLSDMSDQEGRAILDDFEWDYVMRRVCSKCYLERLKEENEK